MVSLEWDIPTDSKVHIDLWSSSDSDAHFKKEFASTAQALKKYISFTPRYFIWDGKRWKCDVTTQCSTQCLPGGLYCNPDPDMNLFFGISGNQYKASNSKV